MPPKINLPTPDETPALPQTPEGPRRGPQGEYLPARYTDTNGSIREDR